MVRPLKAHFFNWDQVQSRWTWCPLWAPATPNPTALMRNESDHSCIEMQIFKDDGVSNYSIFLPMEFVNEQRLGPHFSGHFTRVRAGLLIKYIISWSFWQKPKPCRFLLLYRKFPYSTVFGESVTVLIENNGFVGFVIEQQLAKIYDV